MKTCEQCGQQWEDEFFCKKCSEPYWDVVEVPNTMWSGDPEMVLAEEWYQFDICKNCCGGHPPHW